MTAGVSGRRIRVRFPEAQEVCVMGQFNNWSTVATPLVHVGGWIWEVTLPLEAEVRGLGYFVWQQGQRFGHIVRAVASSGGESHQPVAL